MMLLLRRFYDRRQSSFRSQTAIRLLNSLTDLHRINTKQAEGSLQQFLFFARFAAPQEGEQLLKFGDAETQDHMF